MVNKKYPYYIVGEPTDLKDLIRYCADSFGAKTAFRYRQRGNEITVSFKQFQQDVNAFGTYLHGKGYKNAHIALMGENSYAWIVSYFAIVNGGNVVVPIDKDATQQDVCLQLENSDASLFIHAKAYESLATQISIASICLSQFSNFLQEGQTLLAAGFNSFVDIVVDKEKMCAIVFTSGTTAAPKGVMLNHRNLVTDLIVSSKNLCLPEGTVALLPLYHTYGFMASVLCPMLKGYAVYINVSLKRVFDDINFAKPRYIAVVPMIVAAIYDKIFNTLKSQGKEKQFCRMVRISNMLLKCGIDIRRNVFKKILDAFGGNLEMIITGGAPIDEKYVKFFRDIGISITSGYGITECSPIVATMRNKHYEPSSVGTLNPEIEGRIMDGEVQIKGPVVFSGYYKNPQATEEAFDGEWFRTGDLGSLSEDGFLYITGRKKNLIILSNGKNVVPEELEAMIMNHISQVKEVLVYGENDIITAELFCNIEVENEESVIRDKIEQLNKNLPSYKQIASVKYRDSEFPKTTTKKIKRNR